ncbi:AP2-like ethylene-responsive transcription factor ANT isoform X1 [Senna tora]|uniref:AP2-like ethylene-responsive transcription factor ANT isoform X1 n=1 Tax=Senna tora TaxID=362788 RepID=A0A834T483_9FABA|nr:AP2-like ethylene-responsive transcription factor ANT isoform X1 [Senna tora]
MPSLVTSLRPPLSLPHVPVFAGWTEVRSHPSPPDAAQLCGEIDEGEEEIADADRSSLKSSGTTEVFERRTILVRTSVIEMARVTMDNSGLRKWLDGRLKELVFIEVAEKAMEEIGV